MFFDHSLAQITAGPRSISVFRNIMIELNGAPHNPFVPDPSYAGVGGRWGSEQRTLYTATTATTSWAEWCRNHADAVEEADPTGGAILDSRLIKQLAWEELSDAIPARAMIYMTYNFKRLADLTTLKARQQLLQLGFNPDDLYTDDYGRCPELARDCEALGWDAICVPSAAYPGGTCIDIFEQGRSCNCDWEIVQSRGRPPCPVAFSTTYKTGEQPEWVMRKKPLAHAA